MSPHGHGHVVPRPDGFKARCGGPALCMQCRREQLALDALRRPATPAPGLWHWALEYHDDILRVYDPSRLEYVLTSADRHALPMRVRNLMQAMLDALTAPQPEPVGLVADLVELVHRLANAERDNRADPQLQQMARTFLHRQGLGEIRPDADAPPPQISSELNDLLNDIEALRFECAAGPLDMHPAWARVRALAYADALQRRRMTAEQMNADIRRRRIGLALLPPDESPSA